MNLVVYGNDRFIKIYDFNLNLLSKLSGHNGIVLSVIKINNIFISGGTDKKIFLWDSITFKSIDFFYGFTSYIK